MLSELFVAQNLYVVYALLAWELAWKGVALWKSARNNHLVWFVALMVINSLGILPIFYIFILPRLMKKQKFARM